MDNEKNSYDIVFVPDGGSSRDIVCNAVTRT